MRSLVLPLALLTFLALPARGQDDHPNIRSLAATPITVDGPTVAGSIEVAGDRDWFRFVVQAGQTCTVFTTGLSPDMDSFVDVYTPQGRVVGRDGSGGGARNGRVTFTAATTGGHYVRITHEAGRTGTYQVGATTAAAAPPPPPDAPTGVTATATGPTRVELRWTDASDDEDAFHVEVRGPAGTFLRRATLARNTTTWVDGAAIEGAAHEYRVVAANGNGEATSAATGVITPPAPPRGVGAAGTPAQVVVTWLDGSAREAGFRVERRLAGATTFDVIAAVGADVTTYTDAPITAGATYEYRVVTTGPGGESAGPLARVTTVAPAPAAPANLTALTSVNRQVDLTWTDRSNDETGFRVERRLFGAPTFDVIATLPAGSRSHTDAGLAGLTRYEYRVVAFNAWGDSAPAQADVTTLIDSPEDLVALAAGPTRVELRWTDASTGETGFIVQRAGAVLNFSTIATLGPDVTAYADTRVAPGEVYHYRVRATTTGRMSAPSDLALVTTPLPPAPPAPTDLAAFADAPATVRLAWVDRANAESGYRVERRGAGGAFATIATLPVDATAHVDAQAPAGRVEYRVVATSPWGDAASEVVAVTTPPLGGALNGDFEAGDLRGWSVVGAAGTPFQVDVVRTAAGTFEARLRGAGDSRQQGLAQDVVTGAGPLTIEARVTVQGYARPGGVVSLHLDGAVVARHDFGMLSSSPSAPPVVATLRGSLPAVSAGRHELRVMLQRPGPVDALTPTYHVDDVRLSGAAALGRPAAPTNLRVLSSGASGVTLAWSDGSTDEVAFRIERSPAGGGAFVEVGRVAANATRFTDPAPVPAGGVAEYRVFATNAGGDSPASNVARTPTPGAPAAPSGFAAAPDWPEVLLTWSHAGNALRFSVERALPGGALEHVGVTSGTSFVDRWAAPATTYEYRVVATNDGGASAPATLVVTTAGPDAPPPPPGALTATVIGPNRVELSWTDPASDEVGFLVERKASTDPDVIGYTRVATLPANTTTWVDTEVRGGVSYEYRTMTVGPAGHSSRSNVAAATTPLLPAPTDLRAPVATWGWVELRWTDQATFETGFRIERRRRNDRDWGALGTVAADVTRFVDTTAAPASDWEYQVVAETTGGQSSPSNVVWVVTPPPPTPATPWDLRAVAAAPMRVELSWTDHAVDETAYWVQRRRPPNAFVRVATLPADVAGHVDLGVLPGETYEYRVLAVNDGGPAPSGAVTVTTPAAGGLINGDFESGDLRGWGAIGRSLPAVVEHDVDGDGTPSRALCVGDRFDVGDATIVQAVALAPGRLELRADVAAERRMGQVSLLLDGVLVDVATDTSRTTLRGAIDVTSPGLHEVRLVVEGLFHGDLVYVDDIALAGSALPAAPAAPTTLGVTAASATRVELAWRDASSDEAGFRVQRSRRGGVGFTEVARVGADVTTFVDTSFEPGAAYEYRVVATGPGGDSAPSNVAVAPLPGRPGSPGSLAAVTNGAAGVTLTWTDRSTNEVGFLVERRLAGGWRYAQLAVVPPGTTSYHDASAAPLGAYDYRVIAFNDAGESNPARVSAVAGSPPAPPGRPTNAVATSLPSGVLLTWTPASGVSSYRLRRKVDGGWPALLDALPASAASYVDAWVEPGVSYVYELVAIGAGGASPAVELRVTAGPQAVLAAAAARVEARGPYRALLTWRDVSDAETGYRVERRPAAGGAFATVAELWADATCWLDEGLDPASTHEYRVVAVRRQGVDAAPAAAPPVTTPPPTVPANGDFGARDLRGWTVFGPTTDAVIAPTLFDVDGDGRLSWCAVVRRAGHGQQVGLSQQVTLQAGSLELSVNVAGAGTNDAGVVSLVFDGVVVARHDFGRVVLDRAVLRASLPAVTAGAHEVRLMVERPFLPSAPEQWFDDLVLTGTAVPAP